AVGEPGATQFAQLCADNVIAVVPDLYCLGSLSHEIGHAMVAWTHGEHKFGDEQLVSVEERAFLARLARLLLTERCGSTVWLPMSWLAVRCRCRCRGGRQRLSAVRRRGNGRRHAPVPRVRRAGHLNA